MESLKPLLMIFLSISMTEAFYKPVYHKKIKTVVPATLKDLEEALCRKQSKGSCKDDEPVRIIIEKHFDFRSSQGSKTVTGCFHRTSPAECLRVGQLQLNVAHQCDGLQATKVRYDVAGKTGLVVGSNKYIEGRPGGAIIGRGLLLSNVENIEVKNLQISDINPQVIWGGDAIDIRNSKNILVDGCYIKNIGRQMIVTSHGSNTGILVNNTVFDGRTPFSSHCNGNHYWLWLFLGTAEQIALQNNVVFNMNGRGPHLVAKDDSKTVVHLIQNIFYNIRDMGLIELQDSKSSILAEGNIIYDVSEVVHICEGHVFLPLNKEEAKQCQSFLGRDCLINTVLKSSKAISKNPETVLQDFKKIKHIVQKPISMTYLITRWPEIPNEVKQILQ